LLEIAKAILSGILIGAITALLGYLKNSTTETFNPKKALQTVIVGAAVGGIAGYNGWTYEQAEQWAATAGITVLIEYVKKAVWRRITHEQT